MKTFFSFILCVCCVPLILQAQNTKNITLKFDVNDFDFEEENGLMRIQPLDQLYFYKNDSLTPALPFKAINVLIPANKNYLGFNYIRGERLIHSNILLETNSLLVPTNMLYKYNQYSSSRTMYSKGFYPDTYVEYVNTSIIDGYQILSFVISPFRYDATNRNLFLNDSIMITINMTTNVNGGQSVVSHKMHDVVEGMVVNPEDMDLLYPPSQQTNPSTTTQNPLITNEYKYLIITRDSLKEAFQPLVEWKTMKGVPAKTLTIEEINEHYGCSSDSLQLKIKNALYDYYNGTHSNLQYVLQGGDVDIVPQQGCYVSCVTDIDTLTYTDAPCDLYYGCYDGAFDWNANGNTIYGEKEDNISLLPNVHVSRLPVKDFFSTQVLVNRIINYEKGSSNSSYTNRMLIGGAQLNSIISGKSDAQLMGEKMKLAVENTSWEGDSFLFFDTYTDFSGGANYTFNDINLSSQLSSGYSFVNIITHGYIDLWRTEAYAFTVDNALSINNINNTIITTSSCQTNAYDRAETCLSEALMRNPNSGIVAYLGSSREGLSPDWRKKQYLEGSDLLNKLFYQNLLNGTQSELGPLVNSAKNIFILLADIVDVYRWVAMLHNPLGDPEMTIQIDTLADFSNVNIQLLDNGSLSVASPTGTKVCVMSKSDAGKSFYKISSGMAEGMTFDVGDDEYSICITQWGYKPLLATIHKNRVVLQNETVNNDKTIVANEVYIGSNVTAEKPQGPVIIESGKVNIRGLNNVTITKDFEVKQGAELIIQ